MKKIKEYLGEILTVSSVAILVFSISYVNFKNNEILETAAKATTSDSSLSSSKIEWGVSRGKDHMQPDFGSKNIKLMEENNGIYIGNKDKKYIYLTFD